MIKTSRPHRLIQGLPLASVIVCLAFSKAYPACGAAETGSPELRKAWKIAHDSPKSKIVAQLKAGLDKNPHSAEWNEVMAEGLASHSDGQAVTYAETALSLNPKSVHILATCALCSLRHGDIRRAFRLASRALRSEPTNARALAVLGSCYFDMSQETPAAESFQRALESAPNDFDVNQLAITYYGHTLDDRALECANRLVKYYPNSAEAYFERAKVKRGDENPAVGLPDFDKAIALDPGLTDASVYRGRLLVRLERNKEAVTDFDRAMQTRPTPQLLFRRAISLLRVSKPKQALGDLNLAIKICNQTQNKSERVFVPSQKVLPNKDYMMSWLKRMSAEIDVGYQDLALADANEILKIDHACDSALAARQALLRKQGRYAQAIQDLDILIKLNPDVSDWYEARSEAYSKLNRTGEAAADLATAKHIDEFGK